MTSERSACTLAGCACDSGVEDPVTGVSVGSASESKLNMDLETCSPVERAVGAGRTGAAGGGGRCGGCGGGALGARLWMSEAASLPKSSAFRSSVASSRMRPSTRRTIFPITGSWGAARASRDPALWTLDRSWSTSCHLDLATTWRRICAVAFAHSSPLTCLRLRRLQRAVRCHEEANDDNVQSDEHGLGLQDQGLNRSLQRQVFERLDQGVQAGCMDRLWRRHGLIVSRGGNGSGGFGNPSAPRRENEVILLVSDLVIAQQQRHCGKEWRTGVRAQKSGRYVRSLSWEAGSAATVQLDRSKLPSFQVCWM